MSHTRSSFLAATRANPDDDLPRLVYADWLDEQQTPAAADHAWLIRWQCGAKRRAGDIVTCDASRRADMVKPGPFQQFKGGGRFMRRMHRACLPNSDLRFYASLRWHRGFVAHAFIEWCDWLSYAESLLTFSAGLEVRFATRVVCQNIVRESTGRMAEWNYWLKFWFDGTRLVGADIEDVLKYLWPEVRKFAVPSASCHDPITLVPRRMLSNIHITPELLADSLPPVPAHLLGDGAGDSVYAGRYQVSHEFRLRTHGRPAEYVGSEMVTLRSFLPPPSVVIDNEERLVLDGDPATTPPGGVIFYDEHADLTPDQCAAIVASQRPNSAVTPTEDAAE